MSFFYMVSEIKEPKVTTYTKTQSLQKYWKFQRYSKGSSVISPGTKNGLDQRCLITQKVHRLETGGTVDLRDNLIKHKDAKIKVKYVTLWAGKEA